MFLDANSHSRINASGAKDIEWNTWSCILGFPVQGIWPGPDYTEVMPFPAAACSAVRVVEQ